MPRPVACQGSLPTSAECKCGASFEELLGLLRAEHERLERFVDAQAAENHALRKRLLCEGAAVQGVEEPWLTTTEPSSLWRRRQLGCCHPTVAVHPGINGQGVPSAGCSCCQPLAPALHAGLKKGAALSPGSYTYCQHSGLAVSKTTFAPNSEKRHSGTVNDALQLTSEGGGPSGPTVKGSQPLQDLSLQDVVKDRRTDACIQKLRDMLDVGLDRQTLSTDQIEAYFKRVGLYTADFGVAVGEIVQRLRDGQQVPLSSTKPTFFQSMSTKSGSKLSRMLSDTCANNSVQLQAMAELLLSMDAEEILDPCTPDMLEVLKLLRTHAFHQDIMGILPSAVAVNDLEKDYKENKFDQRLDIFMNIVIAANAICMGVFAQEEAQEWSTPQVLDIIFTVIFVLEALLKMNRFGLRRYFCGPDWLWNIFDLCIVALGVGDFIMTLAVVSTGSFNTSSLMVLRLLRLGRLLRVIRMSLFREMKLMLNGIVGLLRTLGSATGILVVSIYMVAALMVQFFSDTAGESEIVHGQDMLFGNVPRAMFTVFRCLNLGDCSAADGTPIALQMSEAVGWTFTVAHCFFSVLMNYGFGSLITALVVDTTLNEAKKAEFRASLKESYKKQISWSLHCLERIFEEAQNAETGGGCDERPQDVPSMLFLSRRAFQQALKRPDVQRILDEIDIDESDRADIFDAIDADGNGHIEIDELVSGLTRMSGKARRADTVAARLKMDSLVKRLRVTHGQIMDEHRQIREHLDALALGSCASTPAGPVSASGAS